METEKDIYRELQRHLDNMPAGFPATESGVEIRILKHLFTPEEAEIALHLSALPESLERIYRRVKKSRDIPKEELEEMLDSLVEKGVILGGKVLAKGRDGKFYSKAQFAIGIFELQVNRLTKEFAQDFFQYGDEAFAEEFHTKKTSQTRTIPINKSIRPEYYVGTYDNARLIVQNATGPISVHNCVCREAGDKLEQPCKQTDIRETCLTFQEAAEFLIDSGVGRELSKEEALGLLGRAEKVGMVIQPENSQEPLFICCCCSCCCGVLTLAKKFPGPAEYFHTNFFAAVDANLCTGCQTCLGRCQMEAISTVDNVANVNLNRCIGCGLCTTTCKANAIKLVKKETETVPPKNHDALYKKIMMEKFGPLGTLKIVSKMLLGRKI
jgi:Pyruvate/2-oxoacid:ferredoxin oxidoreductase delta subunit